MVTITIPKKVTRGEELIVVPRKEYEKLLKITKKGKKVKTQLDRDLENALEDVKAGRLFGPFKTVKEFKKSIEDIDL
jgi:hypothetical protein